LFGIVQGGVFPELRVRPSLEVSELSVAGFALGGFSLGEPYNLLCELVSRTVESLDPVRPRYLMGVGTPADLLEGVRLGVDMFDCILPTRLARHGQLYTSNGSVRLKNALSRGKEEPIDPLCDCYACKTFSLGYLAHLYRIGDPSVFRLNTLHNLRYYGKLLEEARHAIGSGRYDQWVAVKLSRLSSEREGNG
jgi:queuine tRNA-ribosyltransferase